MTRVLSGAVLIAIAVAVVWYAPPVVFFAVAEILLLLAFLEYARLAASAGTTIPGVAAGAVTLLTSIGVSSTEWIGDSVAATAIALDAILMSGFVLLAALTLTTWRGASTTLNAGPSTPLGVGDDKALGLAAAAVFPALYL